MGPHWWDLLALALLGLIIFGPKRLPEIGSSIGKTIREFQKSIREVTDPTPPSSVPPSAAQSAQPVTATLETAPVIESAPQATVVEEGAPPLVEEDAVR
jgi:sec-independent protein translocase protein TatA